MVIPQRAPPFIAPLTQPQMVPYRERGFPQTL